jgi:hypothetical protein
LKDRFGLRNASLTGIITPTTPPSEEFTCPHMRFAPGD